MDIAIRQATLHDRDAIWQFMAYAYGEESPELVPYKFPERWNWLFAKNPLISAQDGTIPAWIAFADGEIAGSIGAIPMTLHAGSETFNGGWGCDLIVSKKFRGLGLGKRLLEVYARYFQVISHVSQARSTQKICDKFGSVTVAPVSVMWKPVHMHGKFVFRSLMGKTAAHPKFRRAGRFLCKYLFLDHIVALAGNGAAAIMQPFVRPRRKPSPVEVAELKDFDAEFGEFIETQSGSYDVIVHRTEKFLTWRYRGNPQLEYRLFIARRNGKIAGYIAIRMPHPAELDIGIIGDLFAARNDSETVDALVRQAIFCFGNQVDVIETLVSHDFIKKRMRRLGFFTIKKYTPIFLCMDPAIKERLMNHRTDWFLTYADHDLDQIHPRANDT